MATKRFQECNWYEKLWRYRFYLAIPFKWIWFKNPYMSGKNLWKLLIGEAQANMNWTYTMEEVMLKHAQWKKHPWCECEQPDENYLTTEMDEPYCMCLKCNEEVKNPSKWKNDEN